MLLGRKSEEGNIRAFSEKLNIGHGRDEYFKGVGIEIGESQLLKE